MQIADAAGQPEFARYMMDAFLPERILERLSRLHPKSIDLSLGRIERLLEQLGRPQDRLPPIFHVAGTNGKGSSVAFLRAMLEADNRKVHVYTSPHLLRFNERIRLAGKLVEDRLLIETLEYCERLNQGAPITLFEITTAAALWLFSQVEADFLLLEVGLGGRLDTTNVIKRPLAALITPISIDHPEFLGASLQEISAEKAGIIKSNAPVFSGRQDGIAARVLEKAALRHGATLTMLDRDFDAHEENGRLIYQDRRGLIDLPLPRLKGRHQYDNAALAIAALRASVPDLSEQAFARGLEQVNWPARLQPLTQGPLLDLLPPGSELWLDGGHNADGGRILAQAMADFQDRQIRPLILICGTLNTKDTKAFLMPFQGLVQEVIAVCVPGEVASRSADDVAALARQAGLPSAACEDLNGALRFLAARHWHEPPRVLIAGSLYLAGAVLAANGQTLERDDVR